MPKPKEQPKVRVYVYEHLLEMLRETFPQLAFQTDSEIINHLMTEKLGTGIQKTTHTTSVVQVSEESDLISFDDEVD